MNTVAELPFGKLNDAVVWPKSAARESARYLEDPEVVSRSGSKYLIGVLRGQRMLSFGPGTRVLSFSKTETPTE